MYGKKIIAGLDSMPLALVTFVYMSYSHLKITKEHDKPNLGEGEMWFDDWYTITKIDENTYATGEPRYWQKNYCYLIISDARGILWDSGPGVRGITPVVKSLASLPITVALSHSHYDHFGNNHRFKSVALGDLPSLREQVRDGIFQPSVLQAFKINPSSLSFRVAEWWKPGEMVDINGRQLKVLHLPGHSEDSTALLDIDRHQIFTGDFIYPDELIAFGLGASIQQYLRGTRHSINETSGEETLCGAHTCLEHSPPFLKCKALTELDVALEKIMQGNLEWESEFLFRRYSTNPYMSTITAGSINGRGD